MADPSSRPPDTRTGVDGGAGGSPEAGRPETQFAQPGPFPGLIQQGIVRISYQARWAGGNGPAAQPRAEIEVCEADENGMAKDLLQGQLVPSGLTFQGRLDLRVHGDVNGAGRVGGTPNRPEMRGVDRPACRAQTPRVVVKGQLHAGRNIAPQAGFDA